MHRTWRRNPFRCAILPILLVAVACDVKRVSGPDCSRDFLLEGFPIHALERHSVGGENRPAVEISDTPVRFTARCGGLLRFAVAPKDPDQPTSVEITVRAASTRSDEPIVVDGVGPGEEWREVTLETVITPGTEITFSTPDSAPPAWLADPIVEPTRSADPRLVVVVLIDTLRVDHTSLGDHELPTSPELAELARESLVFRRAYSTSSWTRPAVASLLTSLPPEEHRVWQRNERLRQRVVTWPEIARQHGFQTVAIVTNPNILPVWGFAQGFSRFIDLDSRDWAQSSDARSVFAEATRILSQERTPLFLYIHLMDPHNPYDPPVDSARALFPDYSPDSPGREPLLDDPKNVQHMRRRYDGEIRHVDSALGTFVDDLKARGLFEASILVVVSDHGEEFLDHGGFYHGGTLYEEQLRIPLLIKPPDGRAKATEVDAMVSIVDALPTAAGFLGWDAPPGSRGQDLRGVARGTERGREVVFAQLKEKQSTSWAVITDREKLIETTGRNGSSRLFDLEADPGEKSPLNDPGRKASLLRLLEMRLAEGKLGWRLKLCGGSTKTRMTLRISGISGAPVAVDLEEEDSLSVADQTVVFTSVLDPRTEEIEFLGERVNTLVRDQEILRFEADFPELELLAFTGARPKLGVGLEARPLSKLRLLSERWTRPPYEAPRCPQEDDEPRILVWHVADPGEAETASPDSEVLERMRALGYVE